MRGFLAPDVWGMDMQSSVTSAGSLWSFSGSFVLLGKSAIYTGSSDVRSLDFLGTTCVFMSSREAVNLVVAYVQIKSAFRDENSLGMGLFGLRLPMYLARWLKDGPVSSRLNLSASRPREPNM